ncbi:c-type cytochrome [Histidinibacterium lentulum]|uniref:Cytochrome c family protein n=1 Tax=Histidinibacterium lentulum TaxID=2480588 RepID=A0A3N2R1F6_9RHOB|nr:c-type cytochrome [Histidinibacterium lentulum]ROU01304.1 cytochrome c family protein [Histidinibacterium lentulum]
MFDTMTLTKLLGGFCGALLIFLLGSWASSAIYGSYGHYHPEQAYIIPVEGDEVSDEPVEEGPSFEEVFASADAAAGEALWRNCQACHATEQGVNGTGPYLHGVVGREIAAVDGFNYSGALQEKADVWSPENLNAFLEDPSGWAPGTSMGYNGMRRVGDRANLIAYLDSLDD